MPERENIMTVEDVLKVCVFDIRVVTDEDGETVYAPFSGKWNPEWDSRKVLWIDANDEGTIIVGI